MERTVAYRISDHRIPVQVGMMRRRIRRIVVGEVLQYPPLRRGPTFAEEHLVGSSLEEGFPCIMNRSSEGWLLMAVFVQCLGEGPSPYSCIRRGTKQSVRGNDRTMLVDASRMTKWRWGRGSHGNFPQLFFLEV